MTVVRFEKLITTGHTEPNKILKVESAQIDLEKFHVPDNKILIQAEAWALNPTDWKHSVYKFGNPGALAGSDVSGVVVKVGKDVEKIEVGDHVSAFLRGSYDKSGNVGAFAGYTLIDDYATINYGKDALKTAADSKGFISPGLVKSFEGAASITLSLFTCGVVFNNGFELSTSSPDSYRHKKVIIWGGATATGFVAIQVAKHLYHLDVIAVASAKHHELLKKLGADHLYDYKTPGVTELIKKEHPDIYFGLDTISDDDTYQTVYDTLGDNSYLNTLLFPTLKRKDESKNVKQTYTLLYDIQATPYHFGPDLRTPAEGVRIDFDDFMKHKLNNEFVRNQLVHTKLRMLNENHSFLKSVEEGYNLMRNNEVSGEKLVVRANDVVENRLS